MHLEMHPYVRGRVRKIRLQRFQYYAIYFSIEGDVFKVKSRFKEGIQWRVGDVTESGIVDALGSQDIVVANNFLSPPISA